MQHQTIKTIKTMAKAVILHWYDALDRRFKTVHIVNNDEDIKRVINRISEIEDYEIIDYVGDNRGEKEKIFE